MKVLLEKVGVILKHQEELKIAKGETFNIFSILKLERAEVKTHSAFLAELLNPKGSHLMGNTFLEAFLRVIKHHSELDISTAKVFVEYHLGAVTDTTGGRIDILIQDHNGNCITIENKIDAADQKNQLLRYKNYNTTNNTVYYLNIDGKNPDNESKGELETGNDFHIISYRDEIIVWLEQCLAYSVDQPILRESIKQYILLIKKITNTLDDKHEKEVTNLIINHLEEAEQVAIKYNQVLEEIRERFRKELIVYLSNLEVFKDFKVESNKHDINANYSAIWIPKIDDTNKMFGIGSFSGKGHLEGNMFIGLYDKKNRDNYTDQKFNSISSNTEWVHHKLITYEFNGDSTYTINLGDKNFLKHIAVNSNLDKVLEEVKSQIFPFIEENINYLNGYGA